jgi:hypothetical protein
MVTVMDAGGPSRTRWSTRCLHREAGDGLLSQQTLDVVRPEADRHHRALDTAARQCAELQLQSAAVPVDGQQALWFVRGQRQQALALPGTENDRFHSPPWE